MTNARTRRAILPLALLTAACGDIAAGPAAPDAGAGGPGRPAREAGPGRVPEAGPRPIFETGPAPRVDAAPLTEAGLDANLHADCSLDGQPYPPGTLNPMNPCEVCSDLLGTGVWSPVTDGASCGDPAGVCCAGSCVDAQTDDQNCGGCGLICTASALPGAGCSQGTCVNPVETHQAAASMVAVDATNLYWLDVSCPSDAGAGTCGGSVMKQPLAGGAVVTLASGQLLLQSLAIDDTNVYWTTGSTVMSVPLAGDGSPVTLASGPGTNGLVAVNSTSVYWTNFQIIGSPPTSTLAFLYRVARSPSATPQQIASYTCEGIYGLAADESNVYWVNPCLETDAGQGSAIMKKPEAGGPTVTLASVTGPAGPLAIDSANAYFASGYGVFPAAANLMRVPLAGGTTTALTTTGEYSPVWLVSDGANLYWNGDVPNPDGGDRYVVRMPVLGGAAVTFKSPPSVRRPSTAPSTGGRTTTTPRSSR